MALMGKKPNGEHSLIALSAASAVDVTPQDQVGQFYNIHALIETGTFTISTDTVADSYTVDVSNETGTAIATGDTISMSNGSLYIQADVLSRATDTLTLDRFWTEVYDKDLFTCYYGTTDLSVNGAVTAIKAVIRNPMTDTSIDITQIDFLMSHAADFSFDGFAGLLTPLSRGIQLVTDIANGTVRRSGYNFKSNGQIGSILDIHEHLTKVGGSLYGMSGKKYLGISPYLGSVIRLVKAREDSLEIWIQDDLTSLGELRFSIEASAVI